MLELERRKAHVAQEEFSVSGLAKFSLSILFNKLEGFKDWRCLNPEMLVLLNQNLVLWRLTILGRLWCWYTYAR